MGYTVAHVRVDYVAAGSIEKINEVLAEKKAFGWEPLGKPDELNLGKIVFYMQLLVQREAR